MTTKVSLIADGSVNSSAILNTTIKTEDLNSTAGEQAVTTDTIRDGAVTARKLAGDTQAYLSFPLGGIVMWSGTIQQIPAGWYLCDGGTYGGLKTPDLRNKFIVGADTGTGDTVYPGVSIGAEGGSATATLVSHSHTGTTENRNVSGTFNAWDRSQTYPPTGAFQYSGQNYNPQFAGGGGQADTNRGFVMDITHNHDFTTSTEGVSATNANLPPYFALAYIMKCEFRTGSVATITTTTPTLQELRLNGPLYDQEMDGGAQKGNSGDVLTSLGDGNGVRWSPGVPVGSVFHFASSTAPTGYLKANGDTVPNGTGTVQGITADFSLLYQIIGTTYGAVGKLPDLRGEFIRGWDDAKGVDTGRVFGTAQGDDFKSHTHTYTNRTNTSGNNFVTGGPSAINDGALNAVTGATPTTGGTETRPRNIALLACIKF
jgi:microcystin-dependent protein